jgi:hypothetical protein
MIKARVRKVNFKKKDIKNIYNILSENKTGEIIFTKTYEKNEQERRDKNLITNTMRD